MEFIQCVFGLIFYGYLGLTQGFSAHYKRSSQEAIRLPLKHENTLQNLALRNKFHRDVSEAHKLIKKWILPLRKRTSNQEESFEDDCDRVYVAYQKLIHALPKIMNQEEIDASMMIMGSEGFDVHDPEQLHELSCLIVSFARNNLIETLPPEEKQSFEEGLMIFKFTVQYLEQLLEHASGSELVEMKDEVAAVTILIEFYHVLEEIGFIPSIRNLT